MVAVLVVMILDILVHILLELGILITVGMKLVVLLPLIIKSLVGTETVKSILLYLLVEDFLAPVRLGNAGRCGRIRLPRENSSILYISLSGSGIVWRYFL